MSDNLKNDSEEKFVDVDTDDLNEFSELFHGNAKPKEDNDDTNEEEDVTENEEVNDLATEDDDGDEDEVTEDDDSLDEDDDSDDDTSTKKPKSRFQKRIDELTADKREAERRVAELERRFAELEKRDNQPSNKSQEPKNDSAVQAEPDSTEPSPEDKNEKGEAKYPLGEYDPAYIRDLARYTIDQERKAIQAEEEKARTEAAEKEVKNKLQAEWAEKVKTDAAKYEDFFEKGAELEGTFQSIDTAYGEYLANTIMAMDKGPDVLYYLASNLDEAQKIVNMGPTMATVALGRLESAFIDAASGTPAKPKVSKASPPPPINKGTKGRVSVADDTDDLDAFAKKFYSK